jgi:hypothetical protein
LAVRPIHKLAVIVPVDNRFEEDLEETGSKGPKECKNRLSPPGVGEGPGNLSPRRGEAKEPSG